jgi:hypothetical protein
MKKEDWEKKLIASGIASDSVKKYRSEICRNHGFKSVADIPCDMADDLIEIIESYIQIMTDAALNGWGD